ncbi:HesB/IscA family protein [Anaplasma marginale]|uniref:HesB/IscA family protein n=1 Tax=Anaplasma marginale TaxID=770 RepID=UPI001239828D|nr:iron-sulfur cluster assembly accessory protein [Anaplasma marginale]KAA8472366.1 iron-sulfur cluster assembly accessory protein [Anaplasma marginale]KAB0450620.1 iron-sulfur cluster assembly accessory protein [Anaplasma marginale]
MSGLESCGVTLTEGAVNKIMAVLREEGGSSLLKVSVQSGGCAGFKYEFATGSYEDDADSSDEYLEDDDSGFDDMDGDEEDNDEVEGGSDLILSDASGRPILFVDRCSRKFLQDSTIDYVEDINGSRFVVNNPAAKSGCGCGNSFSL